VMVGLPECFRCTVGTAVWSSKKLASLPYRNHETGCPPVVAHTNAIHAQTDLCLVGQKMGQHPGRPWTTRTRIPQTPHPPGPGKLAQRC
jgi:hypothetical protein